MHSSFIWCCTPEKKIYIPNRSNRMVEKIWTKFVGVKHHPTWFMVKHLSITILYRAVWCCKDRTKPCFTKFLLSLSTQGLSDDHPRHRGHLDHPHHQWPWAQSTVSRLGTHAVYPFPTKTRRHRVHPLLRHQGSQLFSCYSRIQSRLIPRADNTFKINKWTILQHKEWYAKPRGESDQEILHLFTKSAHNVSSQHRVCIEAGCINWLKIRKFRNSITTNKWKVCPCCLVFFWYYTCFLKVVLYIVQNNWDLAA